MELQVINEVHGSPSPLRVGEVQIWRVKPDRERRALRAVLARYLGGDPEEIALRVGEHGKPELADPSATLRFNLSHSGDLALVAVTDGREVGIDVERIDPRRNVLRLADRALDPVAAAAVRAAPPHARHTAFHRAWTRREAVAKCLGVGLGAPLPRASVAVTQLEAGSGFAAALAVSGR